MGWLLASGRHLSKEVQATPRLALEEQLWSLSAPHPRRVAEDASWDQRLLNEEVFRLSHGDYQAPLVRRGSPSCCVPMLRRAADATGPGPGLWCAAALLLGGRSQACMCQHVQARVRVMDITKFQNSKLLFGWVSCCDDAFAIALGSQP